MPEYTFRNPKTGQTITVRGPSPPSEAELDDLFDQAAKQGPTASAAPASAEAAPAEENWAAVMQQKMFDPIIGAVKGAGSTVKHLADAARATFPNAAAAADRLMPPIQIGDTLEPTNTAQRIGKTVEQAAEYAVPSRAASLGALKLAPKLAPVLGRVAGPVARSVTQGASAVPVAAAQGGDIKMAAATGAALPLATAGAAEGSRQVGRLLLDKAVNPTVSKLKTMTGGDPTARGKELVDLILNRRITSPAKAERLMDLEDAEINRVMSSREGMRVTDTENILPGRVAAMSKEVGDAPISADELAAIGSEESKLLAGPLGRDVVKQPAQFSAAVNAQGQPIQTGTQVMGRELRPDVTAQEALQRARAQAKLRRGKNFMEKGTVPTEFSKRVELGLRDAAKEVAPSIVEPSRRYHDLIHAQELLEAAPRPPGALSVGGRFGDILALLKAAGGQGGIGLDRVGQFAHHTLDEPVIQGLIQQLLRSRAQGGDQNIDPEVLQILMEMEGKR